MTSTHPARRQAAARRTLRRGVLALVALALTPIVRLGAQTDVPGAMFGAAGLQPDRGYFGQLPFEQIDMVNGNLLLTFTDLALPGNAGMDLRIIRTYNHQGPSPKWHFGFAGVPIRLIQPVAPDPEPGEGPIPWQPALVMADGSSHRLYEAGADLRVTSRFWRYTVSTRTLQLPNGWTATYESGNPVGGVMLVKVEDVYGNSITPDWEGAHRRTFGHCDWSRLRSSSTIPRPASVREPSHLLIPPPFSLRSLKR